MENPNDEIILTDRLTGARYIARPLSEKKREEAIEIRGEFMRNPSSLQEVHDIIFSPLRDYKGKYVDENNESWEEWELPEEGRAFFQSSHQHLLEKGRLQTDTPKPPKLVEKNLDTLANALQRENAVRAKNGLPNTRQISFSLKEYALMRGYTEQEIDDRNVKWEELKKDLISGARTTYSLKGRIGGKEYTRHGFPSFYFLDEPKNPKDPWIVSFKDPWYEAYLSREQFFPVLMEAIKDRSTEGKRAYLYTAHKKLMRQSGKWEGKQHPRPKVETFLRSLGVGERVFEKPNKSYKTLIECLQYNSGLMPFNEISLYYGKEKTTLPLPQLLDMPYQTFRAEILPLINATDVRKLRFRLQAVRKEQGESDKGVEVTTL